MKFARASQDAAQARARAESAGKGGSIPGGANPNSKNDIENDAYVDTMKWKPKSGYVQSHNKAHAADDPNYEIHTVKGTFGTSYRSKFKGETFSSNSNMHAAKAAAEIHKAGHWTEKNGLRFWNVPDKPVRRK